MALAVVFFGLLFLRRYPLSICIALGALVHLLAIKALHVVRPADMDLIEDYLPPQLRGVASKIGAFLLERKPTDQPEPSTSER